MINGADQRIYATVFDADTAQILERFFLAKIDKFAFDLRAYHHGFGTKMILRILSYKIDMLGRGIRLIAAGDRSQIGFRDVAREERRL